MTDLLITLIYLAALYFAYHTGYVNGSFHGAVSERERRNEEDERVARVAARIEAQPREMSGEEWPPREIDTDSPPPFLLRPDVRRYLGGLDDLEDDR